MIVPFEYAMTLIRVIDGDTLKVDVDLGFHVWIRMSCRLAWINTRELSQPGGPEARAHLVELLSGPEPLAVRSVRADKYAGRFDGEVFKGRDELSISQRMVLDGYASVWNGTGEKPIPAWPVVPIVRRD